MELAPCSVLIEKLNNKTVRKRNKSKLHKFHRRSLSASQVKSRRSSNRINSLNESGFPVDASSPTIHLSDMLTDHLGFSSFEIITSASKVRLFNFGFHCSWNHICDSNKLENSGNQDNLMYSTPYNNLVDVSLPNTSEIIQVDISTIMNCNTIRSSNLKCGFRNENQFCDNDIYHKKESGKQNNSRRQLVFNDESFSSELPYPLKYDKKTAKVELSAFDSLALRPEDEEKQNLNEYSCSTGSYDCELKQPDSPSLRGNDFCLNPSPFFPPCFHVTGTLCKKSSQITNLHQFADKFKGVYSSVFTDSTTHVIVNSKTNHKTFKILKGLASKRIIVTYDWILSCLQSNKLVPVVDFMFNEGARRCLMDIPSPFTDSIFLLHNSLSAQSVTAFQEILTASGAVIENQFENFKASDDNKFCIFSNSNMDSDLPLSALIKYKIIPVAVEWILECVYCYRRVSIEPHLSPCYPLELVPFSLL